MRRALANVGQRPRRREPTGPDTMLVFTLGGIEAIGRVDPEDKPPADTLFPFEVNMDRAKLFDPVSGKRLR